MGHKEARRGAGRLEAAAIAVYVSSHSVLLNDILAKGKNDALLWVVAIIIITIISIIINIKFFALKNPRARCARGLFSNY